MEYMQEMNIETASVFTLQTLLDAYREQTVLFAKALVYDKGNGLKFNLGGYEAFMPNCQVYLSFDNDNIKEAAIATRVNKFVCFVDLRYYVFLLNTIHIFFQREHPIH